MAVKPWGTKINESVAMDLVTAKSLVKNHILRRVGYLESSKECWKHMDIAGASLHANGYMMQVIGEGRWLPSDSTDRIENINVFLYELLFDLVVWNGNVSSGALALFKDVLNTLHIKLTNYQLRNVVEMYNRYFCCNEYIKAPKIELIDVYEELSKSIDSNETTPSKEETKPIDPKLNAGSKKLSFHEMPILTLASIAKPFQDGAKKYGLKNFYDFESYTSVYLNALKRHLALYEAGQDNTRDSNVHHVDSMIAGLMVMREKMLVGKLVDDRKILDNDTISKLEEMLNNG